MSYVFLLRPVLFWTSGPRRDLNFRPQTGTSGPIQRWGPSIRGHTQQRSAEMTEKTNCFKWLHDIPLNGAAPTELAIPWGQIVSSSHFCSFINNIAADVVPLPHTQPVHSLGGAGMGVGLLISYTSFWIKSLSILCCFFFTLSKHVARLSSGRAAPNLYFTLSLAEFLRTTFRINLWFFS